MKERVAKAIRIITVPPVLTLAMLGILYYLYGEKFATLSQLVMALILLVLVPSCAYLISNSENNNQTDKRGKQRKMAFIFNLVGYLSAMIIGFFMMCTEMMMCILISYFLAVLILTFVNKVSGVKASGHACSCVLPYLILCYWSGGKVVLICLILYLGEFWASVSLKRHTVFEFISGSFVAIVVFSIVFLLFGFY